MDASDSYNVFEELEKWSKDMEVWLRAALIALIEKGADGIEDLDLIYEEFKIDKVLAVGPAERRDYTFESSAIPTKKDSQQQLLLKSISNTKGINALVDAQELNFGDNLTVIYGPNGSGKSGYARILKAACFTRFPDQNVLGNVLLPLTQRAAPSAEFTFSNGTKATFTPGQVCTEMLSNFVVFDSSCIRVYTDGRTDFNVSPYGFDVFPALVEVTERIRNQLKEEITQRTPDLESLKFEGSTSIVGNKLSNLSDATNLEDLQALSVFGDNERQELEDSERRLDELSKKDPAELVKQKRRQVADLQIISERYPEVQLAINEETLVEIKQGILRSQELNELAKANSVAQFGGEPLQPIGTAAWTTLIKAAVDYAGEAYPGQPFPPDAEDSLCVLCQQSLKNEGSRARLARFYAFVTSETEKKLKEESTKLELLKRGIEKLDLSFLAKESSARRTVEDLDSELSTELDINLEALKKRRDQMVSCIAKRVWEETTPLPANLTPKIDALKQKLQKEIDDLEKDDPRDLKRKLGVEIDLLRDRDRLSKIFPKVKDTVENLRWIKTATNESRKLSTKSITDKQKALTKELIGKGFVKEFKKECEFLKFNLPLEIKVIGESGTTQHKIEIGSERGNLPDPSKVLSEGEQTAVALADFLTEVRLDQRPLGVIFDDPVTSLDHIRKERIAQRLVDEAKRRQVIVFTHDIVLTNHLAQAAEVEHVKFAGRTVSLGYDAKTPGYVGKTVFPNSYYEDMGAESAKELLKEAKEKEGKENKEKLQMACGALRTAYEYFIQRTVFNDVINRWREEVKPFALSDMYYSEELVEKIGEQMGRLSRYIDAHSHSPEYHDVPLTPNVVQEFIDTYYEVTKRFKKERSAFQDKKKKEKKGIYE